MHTPYIPPPAIGLGQAVLKINRLEVLAFTAEQQPLMRRYAY